jgi:hypothetical protein
MHVTADQITRCALSDVLALYPALVTVSLQRFLFSGVVRS